MVTRRTVVTIANRRRTAGRVAITVLAAVLATGMASCSVVRTVANG
jgi:hypothetical protein